MQTTVSVHGPRLEAGWVKSCARGALARSLCSPGTQPLRADSPRSVRHVHTQQTLPRLLTTLSLHQLGSHLTGRN